MTPEKPSHTSGDTPPQTTPLKDANCPKVQFSSIANGHSELIIEHCGQKYRLIATRHGKLVLNK